MKQKTDNRSGFTLIEAVVSTALFAFVITSILGVYLSTIQLDRKSRAQRAVAQNARFIMEYLAKEIRNGTINYGSYPSGTIPSNPDLFIENQANEIERFYLNGTDVKLSKNGNVTSLNSAAVNVTKLQFYIQPAGDPYTVAKTFDQQPGLTVVLELTSNYGTKVTDIVKYNLESTFVIRTYPLRILVGSSLNINNVVWTNASGVSIASNNLTKTGAGGAWDAGASSSQMISSGDGYVEFTSSETNTARMGGLSDLDSNQNYTDLNFAIYLHSNGYVYGFENGSWLNGGAPLSPVVYQPGEIFRISVESNVVKYYRNGALLFTSSQTPTYPLFFDTSFLDAGATITSAKIAF